MRPTAIALSSALALGTLTSACDPPRPASHRARDGAAVDPPTVVPVAAPAPVPVPVPAVPAPSPAGGRVRFVHAAPEGPADGAVREALAEAHREGRSLLVYVGAVWCEPCQVFHRAVERGGLDREFPLLTLVEFDADRDGNRLGAAGYASQMIPLFVVPGDDGRASSRRMEGSIHGEAAIGEMVPRIHGLLGT